MVIDRFKGTVTGKIFENIRIAVSSEALNLLGIIYDKKHREHFPKSYGLFGRLLKDLSEEHGPHYEMETIKGYFTIALGEFEKFVKGRRKKPKEENTTNSESKPVETNQTEENGSNENEEMDFSEEETEPDTDSQDQNLEKLRKDVIAEISQAMQEAKITDQDLAELKENLLAVIQQKKKEKIDDEKLSEFIRKGEGTNDPAELKRIIEQIEKFRGEKTYDALKGKISSLKKKLAEQDIESYCNTSYKMIEQELKDEAIKENELDAEVKKKFQKLKNGGIQQAEIDKIKDEVSNNIKLKSAQRKLKKLLEDYQNSPSEKKKKEIISFIKDSNSFYQEVYRAEKEKVDKLLKGSGSPQKKEQHSSESNFPVEAKYIIGGMIIIAIIFVLAEVIIKKKKSRSR
nr:15249_t:CDS:2 [Entrophospora candida]